MLTLHSKQLIYIFTILLSSNLYSQLVDFTIHLLQNKKEPFWLISNNDGLYTNSSVVSFKVAEKLTTYNYGIEAVILQSQIDKQFLNQAYFSVNNNNIYFQIGKKSNNLKFNNLSSGSFVESSNSSPIPKFSFGTNNYKDMSFLNFKFQYLFKISHGWIYSPEYIKNPFLHEKSLSLKKEISEKSHLVIALDHMAIWAGETILHGQQPSGISDFFKVVFARAGGKNSINQEQNNSLGNHLGAWTFLYKKKYKDKTLSLYLEHPFEDESGARWILNEFDGLYGMHINRNKSFYISQFTYEYINTMDQSGTHGASDSTYGWDNYYNHYLYQSGWTHKGRIIGNPLFTLGSNDGRYSNNQYIINNRIKAHHIGFYGSLFDQLDYRILFTYSENFGIYPDKDYYKKIKQIYVFESGLVQRSGLLEIIINNFKGYSFSLVYGFDNGELLNKTDSFMLKINHKFDI